MKGGYQLINFLGKHLSGDATTVTGVYKALSRSGKAVRIAGLNLSGTMMPEANVNVDVVDDTYIFHVYGYRVEIAPGDQVSISQSDTYDELVEEVSQLNRDLANLMTVVSTDIGGSAVPLVGGGTSIKMDRIEIKKFGHLVNVNVLTWGCPIASPTNDVVNIRMPYRCISTRNRGMCGYNATGKMIIPGVDESGLLFFTHKDSPSSNEVSYKGTDLPNGTWQAQVWYLTDE